METKRQRIESVDALRGFAVMAILLIHCILHFGIPFHPAGTPYWLDATDEAIRNIICSLFAGKAYAIFSLLFGLTFYIQSDHQKRKGMDFGYRFLWRMVLLSVFGCINASFFPAGDVLQLFVIGGIMLFFTRNWPDKAVIVTSVIFLLQPLELSGYLAHIFIPGYEPGDLGVGEMLNTVVATTKSGNFLDFLYCNVTTGQMTNLLWAVESGRMFQATGLFLLGMYMGRKQIFAPTEANYSKWILILIISACASSPLHALKEMTEAPGGLLSRTVATAIDMWANLTFTFVLIASFILLYQRPTFRKITDDLKYYGRMSLTNYVSQSIIGATIFFPYGLNLASYCGVTISLGVGIVIFFVQVKLCKWWLASHRQGPLESLWHKWTWLRLSH